MMNKAVIYISGTTNETVNNMIVEVLDAQIIIPKDDNGDPILIYDEATDTEFYMAQMDYTLGKVLEKSGC